MKNAEIQRAAPAPDHELVRGCLAGDRDAFQGIVTRYQSLVCSIAYSGTGSLSRSEDLAQDTFVSAWKHMKNLREPEKLRSWLCGIARNLVSNSQRRGAREPAEIAGPLDSAHEMASTERTAPEQLIHEEEAAIVWRTLGRIPDQYREPLILYYREHHSVKQVAEELGLSEDAIKQRLSRGRALLQEQVLSFVEGALERTKPGPAFTTAVMSALPIGVFSVTATAGISSAKGSSTVKAGSVTSGAGAPAVAFLSAVLGFVALLGGYAGWQMIDCDGQSKEERIWSIRFWRFMSVVFGGVIVPTVVVDMIWGRSNEWLGAALLYCYIGAYILIGVPFAIWAWENHKRIHGRAAPPQSAVPFWRLVAATLMLAVLAVGGTVQFGFPTGFWTDLWLQIVFALAGMSLVVCGWEWRQRALMQRGAASNTHQSLTKSPSLRWVAVGTVCTAGWLTLLMMLVLSAPGSWRIERISPNAAREILARHPDANVALLKDEGGRQTLDILATAEGKTTRYVSRVDGMTAAFLHERGISPKLIRHDRSAAKTAARSLPLVCLFVLAAGSVILLEALRRRRRGPLPTS